MTKLTQSLDLIEFQQAKYTMLARYASLPVLKDLTSAQITTYRVELVRREREIKLAIKTSQEQLAVLNELELKSRVNLLCDIIKTNLANLQLKSRENASRIRAVDSYLYRNSSWLDFVTLKLCWLVLP